MEWLNKEYSIELHNPLTEEEWDSLTDVDMEHTNSVTFNTKHGKEVVFIKVKHGRWVKDPKSLWTIGHCSCCNKLTIGCEDCDYCPHCGAIMDLEADDEIRT